MTEIALQGVLLGSVYCLFALGQSLIFGVMRLTNTAQGDFIVLATFAGVAGMSLLASIGQAGALAPLVVTLLLMPVAFASGYALQRHVLNGTLGRDPLPSLVVTFGLSIVIQNLLLELFSADPRSIDTAGMNIESLALPRWPGRRRAAADRVRRGRARDGVVAVALRVRHGSGGRSGRSPMIRRSPS